MYRRHALTTLVAWLASGVAGPLMAQGLTAQTNEPTADAASPAVRLAVAPEYPEIAHNARVASTLELDVDVDAEGTPRAFTLVSGHEMLERAATEAARQWRFEPAAQATRRCRLTFVFSLLPEGTPESETATRFLPPYTVEVRRVKRIVRAVS
jgi:TonB family protein